MEVAVLAQLAILSVTLTVISLVDLRTQTIPDLATAVLAVSGVISPTLSCLDAVCWALASGAIYFSLFWAIREGHWTLTGRLGMGFGDVKLAGAAGIWLTPGLLPAFIGIAAASALVSVGAMAAFGGAGVLSRRIPFGPFLALGLMACWILETSNFGLGFDATRKTSGGLDDGTAGFTLVELLVVLGIIGLVAAVVAPRVLTYLSTAKVETAKVQIKNLESALELYYLDIGNYPTNDEGLAALAKAPSSATPWNGPYLKNADELLDPWGNRYVYLAPAEGKDVVIRSLGRDGKEGGSDIDGDLP